MRLKMCIFRMGKEDKFCTKKKKKITPKPTTNCLILKVETLNLLFRGFPGAQEIKHRGRTMFAWCPLFLGSIFTSLSPSITSFPAPAQEGSSPLPCSHCLNLGLRTPVFIFHLIISMSSPPARHISLCFGRRFQQMAVSFVTRA